MTMIHLTARVRCPKCMETANVCVQTEDKVEADCSLSPSSVHVFVCPYHAGKFRVRGTILRAAETCPDDVIPHFVETRQSPPGQKPRAWWRFWA